MSSETGSAAATGGLSFMSLLGLIFITLKLCGVVNWSWWIVLLPLYGPVAAVLTIIAILLLTIGVISLFEKMK